MDSAAALHPANEVRCNGADRVGYKLRFVLGPTQATKKEHLDTDRTLQLMAGGRIGRAALVVCALLAALVFPAAAPAKRGLTTGFEDGDEYQSSDPAERALWLDRTVDSGAGIVRLSVSWASVAAPSRPPDPTNPGSAFYDFSSIDGAVRDAEARGLTVLLTVNGAPDWAEGPGRPASAAPGTWKPNPSDLADFVQALAARYSGSFDPDGLGPAPPFPAAQAIQVWDEPNQDCLARARNSRERPPSAPTSTGRCSTPPTRP